MPLVRLRTTFVIEHNVAESVVNACCNLTDREQIEWIAFYAKQPLGTKLVSVKTEPLDPRATLNS